MRILFFASLSGFLLSACAASKPSQPRQMDVYSTGKSGEAVATRYHKFSGTVETVDTASRRLTIKNEYGLIDTINVPPEVKQFDEVSVGDVIEVEVQEGVLFEYQPAGSAATPSQAMVAQARAATDQPPVGAGGATIQTTVTVTAIDPQNRVVHVRDLDGNVYEVRASPTLKIEKLSVGDRLLATYVATAAISLNKKSNR